MASTVLVLVAFKLRTKLGEVKYAVFDADGVHNITLASANLLAHWRMAHLLPEVLGHTVRFGNILAVLFPDIVVSVPDLDFIAHALRLGDAFPYWLPDVSAGRFAVGFADMLAYVIIALLHDTDLLNDEAAGVEIVAALLGLVEANCRMCVGGLGRGR